MNSSAVGYICVAAVIIFAPFSWSTKIDPAEVKAIAEACAKVGKEPLVVVRPGEGIKMGCKDQPEPVDVK